MDIPSVFMLAVPPPMLGNACIESPVLGRLGCAGVLVLVQTPPFLGLVFHVLHGVPLRVGVLDHCRSYPRLFHNLGRRQFLLARDRKHCGEVLFVAEINCPAWPVI